MSFVGTPAASAPCIVYLAHGNRAFRDQVAFSLLTLHGVAPRAPIRIVVFTDEPDRFTGLAHDVVLYTARDAKADIGRFRYVHRSKIKVLARVLERFPTAAGWVLVDGDTVWSRPPDALLEKLRLGCAVMHMPEGRIGPGFHKKLHACLKRIRPADAEFLMHNSGVLGLPPAVWRAVLDEALAVTDEILVWCWQRGWAEQAAFSIVLERDFDVVRADEAIQHYWMMKESAAGLVQQFHADVVGRDLPARAAAACAFDLMAKIEQVERAKRRNRVRERLKRIRPSWEKRKSDALVITERLRLWACGRR